MQNFIVETIFLGKLKLLTESFLKVSESLSRRDGNILKTFLLNFVPISIVGTKECVLDETFWVRLRRKRRKGKMITHCLGKKF